MRRGVSAGVALLLLACLAACGYHTGTPLPSKTASMTAFLPTASASSTPKPIPTIKPSPTIELATPSPEPEETVYIDPNSPSLKAGLTYDQYEKLCNLINSSLYMGFFKDASRLKGDSISGFLFDFFNNYSEYEYGDDWSFDESYNEEGYNIIIVSPSIIQQVIESAFAKTYKLQNLNNENIVIKNGMYQFLNHFLVYTSHANVYKIIPEVDGRYVIYFNICYTTGDGGTFLGNAIATVKKDGNSIFGFHIQSMVKDHTPRPKIVSVNTSSYLPNNGKKTYQPRNIIDNKNTTAWAPKTGSNEWIQLNFKSPQKVSGMVIRLGDWSGEQALDKSAVLCKMIITFSDGTAIDTDEGTTYMYYENPFIIFDREITTEYIRIFIQESCDAYDDTNHTVPIFISEISPF